MGESLVKIYYKNITSDVIGPEHGISQQQMKELVERMGPVMAKLDTERGQGKTLYRGLPYNRKFPAAVKELAGRLKERCDNFVVLGIGGSALGNIALQTALNPYMYNMDQSQRRGPRLFVFDNVDPEQFSSFLNWIEPELERTVFNVISKSGRTAETASQFLIVRQMLIDKFGPDEYKEHIVATTDANTGTLRKISEDAGFRTLEVPDGVGGRFSVLSPVGLLSAAMCGIDIDRLLEGGQAMDKRVSFADFYCNPAAILAAINWHYYYRGKPMSVMMPYSYALKDLADWYRQLWAESLGKCKDLKGNQVCVGPTPVKALGTTDQHSQVQLYREGPNDKVFTFLQVGQFRSDLTMGPAPDCAPELGYLSDRLMSELFNSEKAATEFALLKSQRPCLTVLFDEVTEYTVGQFIYLYEVVTSLTGLLFGIDAYDQPGVELGKEATFALMGREGFQELANEMKAVGEIDEEFIV